MPDCEISEQIDTRFNESLDKRESLELTKKDEGSVKDEVDMSSVSK